MKIFISYGHGDHTQVVDLLFDALIREGHEPWKDDRYEGRSGIPAGRDFTEVIYAAIDASDFVVAFVTNNTKDKPYCRDERQYAYNQKGTHFIQIRMDYADITLGNARSYIDMSDVIGSNGQLNQRLFDDKLRSLFAAFRDPTSFAEGGFTPWAKFDTYLKVPGALKYHDFIASLDHSDFVGRQWLVEKCKNWAMDSSIPCRLFVILGEAGTGKTAFIRRLAEDEELVRSVHICVYDKPSTRTARDTLKDLAYVLAQNNTKYFEFLKMRNFEQLQDMSIDGLFEFLFIEPLKTETQKYLLVIDGLDEMEQTTGFKPLMKLFRQYAQQLNPNISFLVTGRPDAYITDMLKTVAAGRKMESVLLDKNASREDLRSYIDSKLEQLSCYSDTLAGKLLDACDGNFEYLSLLFREAQEVGLSVFEGTRLPHGLNERYAQYLDRRMETDGINRLSKDQRRLLSVLCAAYEPLPVSVLCAVTGLDDYDIDDELELFGSLIRRIGAAGDEPQICLFTKSFRDFLLGRSFDKYFADHRLGTRLLAQYLTERCSTERALKKHPYLDRYGFVHLLQYASEDPDAVTDYCNTLASSGVDIAQRIASALHLGENAAIRSYWQIRSQIGRQSEVTRNLKGKRSAEALMELVSLMREGNDVAGALVLETDMLLWDPSPAVLQQAEDQYGQALRIREQQYSANASPQTRHELSVVYDRLASLMKRKQTPEGDAQAEQWYRKALELSEQNYRDCPNRDSLRDLSVSYSNLGDMAMRKQTPEDNAQAEQWHRKALEHIEQNHRESPSYQSRQDLSYCYGRLGDLAMRRRTPEGDVQAEQWYLKRLEVNEQNHLASPSYESRRNFSVTYGKLGDLALRKRSPEGDAQAEQWYRKGLEMDEQNYQVRPSYQTRRDLSISYGRLGDLQKRKQTPEGNAEAERWYTKAAQIDEQNYQVNPGYETRRDLSISYGRLGDLQKRKQTPEGNTAAEQWYRKALEMDEQNYRSNPSYQTRRDLSINCGRLGSLAERKQTLAGDAEAEQWYKKALEIDEQNYRTNPSYEVLRDLSIDYGSLGRLARRKQTPAGDAEAVFWYKKALEIIEQNHRTNPSYEVRRDLSINYGRLGDMARRRQTLEGDAEAEQWYKKALEVDEQNQLISPSYEVRRDLSLSYSRLGDLLRSRMTPEGNAEAERWYRKALEVDEQNYRSNPSYEVRRDLAIDYGRLGDMARCRMTAAGDAEAELWFKKALEITAQNCQASPSYESRRDFSLACGRIGDLFKRKQTPEGDALAEQWYKKAAQVDEQNHQDNPSYETRRDLIIDYNRLGDIARSKQTPEGDAQAQQWYLKRLAINLQNHAAAPSYLSRRALAVDYNRLGDLARNKQTPEGDAQAEQWYLKLLEVVEQNYGQKPCKESKNDLLIAYGRLISIAQRKNTPDGQCELSRWQEKYKALQSQ